MRGYSSRRCNGGGYHKAARLPITLRVMARRRLQGKLSRRWWQKLRHRAIYRLKNSWPAYWSFAIPLTKVACHRPKLSLDTSSVLSFQLIGQLMKPNERRPWQRGSDMQRWRRRLNFDMTLVRDPCHHCPSERQSGSRIHIRNCRATLERLLQWCAIDRTASSSPVAAYCGGIEDSCDAWFQSTPGRRTRRNYPRTTEAVQNRRALQMVQRRGSHARPIRRRPFHEGELGFGNLV